MQQTIAVVDDEASVLNGFRRILNASGFAVETFASAEEFVSHGHDNVPSCLIVDINLGGMSGIELRRRLAERGCDIPVVFITGRDEDFTRRDAMNVGCVAYLCKPVSRDILMEAIASAIGRPNSGSKSSARNMGVDRPS